MGREGGGYWERHLPRECVGSGQSTVSKSATTPRLKTCLTRDAGLREYHSSYGKDMTIQ